MRLNPVLEQVGRNPITAVHDRTRALREAGKLRADFSIGDLREPTEDIIPHALREAVPSVSQYPTVSGLPALREAVAGYVERRFGVQVDPDREVLPCSGAKEAIFSTPLAFVDRAAGEAVAWSTPGYPVYDRGARFAGAESVPIPTQDDFIFRASDVPDGVWRKARMLWLCTPHNPAGSVIPRDELARFRERAAAEGTLLCSDECYADIYEDRPPPSLLQVNGTGGVLVYMSLSKRSGMTGYRSGAVVGDPAAISALKLLRTGTGTASPDFVQAAAAAAWGDDRHAARVREIIRERRAVLSRGLAALGWKPVASQAGLYLWAKVDDDLEVADRLLDAGVAVTPGRAFGPGGRNYIRLALVPTVEECEQAMEVMAKCLTAN